MAIKIKPLKLSRSAEGLAQQKLSTLINSMADAVITVDQQVRISTYNAAALNLLDVNNISLGSRLESIFKPIGPKKEAVDITDVVKNTKLPTYSRDYVLSYGDGSSINLYTSIAPVRLGYGEEGNKGFVILLRDITREKSLEEERDEFISVTSHELRTPITIAEGNISNAQFIVDKTGDLKEVKAALKDAHSQVLFLAELINDLATLSRAERGTLTVEVEPFNVVDLIHELADNYLPQCQAKGLKLKVDLDPHLELLSSSKLYVREILQNFIVNSIKYTNEGHVLIGASRSDNAVRFTVEDSGIGISKSDQKRVFDKFFRSGDYRTRQANGTGLGLYVTMKLVKLIGADISFVSELNKGSTFTVVVPNLKKTAIRGSAASPADKHSGPSK